MGWTISFGQLSFGIFDIVCVVAILIGAIVGLKRGFTRSAFKIVAYFLCFIVAALFTVSFSKLLSFIPQPWASLVSFVVLSALAFLLISLIGNILAKIINLFHLGFLDKLIGLVFGIVCALAVCYLIIEFLTMQQFFDCTPLRDNSIIYKDIIAKYAPSVVQVVKDTAISVRDSISL